MLWILYGLLHSIFRAAYVDLNRYYCMDPWRTAFLQALFGFLLLLPAVPLVPWPESSRFYLAAGGVALIFSVGTVIQLGLSAQKNGRVSSIYMPLEALLAGILWTLIAPSMLEAYSASPLVTAGIIGGFIAAAIALLKIRPQDITVANFLIVAPVGLTYAVAGIVTKIILPDEMISSLTLGFLAVNFGVMAVVLGLATLIKKKAGPEMVALPALKAGFITGLFSLAGFGTFVFSVVHAPNPGYTSVLAMMLPVWLIVWHRLRKIDDPGHAGAAAFLVAGTGLTVLLALTLS